MRRFSLIAALSLSALLVGVAAAVPPNNGYIGVFGDPQGTDCCISLNKSGNGRLHILAVTGGASSAGISGAEFKISIEPPAPGALLNWIPAPGVAVSMGNVVDNGNGGGGFVIFNSCQSPTGLAGDKIKLGEIQAYNLNGEHRLVVRRADEIMNGQFNCPSVLLCDGPAYTQVCLTLESGDPALGGEEPMGFISYVGSQTCSGASCGFVDAAPQTWSTVKGLYR